MKVSPTLVTSVVSRDALQTPATTYSAHGCGELSHRRAQCDRPQKCLYCGSDVHSSNVCPEAFLSFSHQSPPNGPKVSTPPSATLTHCPRPSLPIPPPHLSPQVPSPNLLLPLTLHQSLPKASAPLPMWRPLTHLPPPLLQDLMKGTFGTPIREQQCPASQVGPHPSGNPL